jgi:hypothetical protein
MKTLKDLAGLYKTLAQTYMVKGPWRPAYQTGNLFRRVGEYNTPNRMIKSNSKTSISLVLDFAPPNAEYGKYVELGTYKMKARPFAEAAANDTQFMKAVNEYFDSQLEQELDKTFKTLESKFSKLSKRK